MHAGAVITDRFEIERRAGSGGMGTVYRARDRTTGAPVALKLLSGLNPAARARFAREARVLAALRHPGIVRYVAHGETVDGEPYLAMEWLDGEDLEHRLAPGALGVAASLAVVRGAADALAAAHRAGVVHRDVKPSNLFLWGGELEPKRGPRSRPLEPERGPRSRPLEPERGPRARPLERVKVLDFGIARLDRSAAVTRTRTGLVIGTPGYMAPEQARGSGEVDARADVFALGCVLFACVTGRPPFTGESMMEVLAKIVFGDPPRVSSLCGDVPPELDDLVARCMAKERDERPSDAGAVAAAIAALGELGEMRPRPRTRPPPALTTREQRLVSVVVAVGSDLGAPTAAPAVTMDPSEAAEASDLASQKRAELGDVARSFRGRLEVLAGGAVLIALEGGGVATDQAARAARCALAMRERLGAVPMALATGRGATAGESFMGEVVGRAVLLASAEAPTRSIRIDDATAALLGERFDLAVGEASQELVGERESFDADRKLLGKATPCVGREREIGTLQVIYDECVAEPVARVALVTGAAGAGKSRVRQELMRVLERRGDRVGVWVGRGDSVSAGAPLGLLAQALRGAAGISGGEPLEVRRQKWRRRAPARPPRARAARVAAFLGEVVGAPPPDEESPQLAAARADPVVMGDQIRRAFEDLVAAECAVQPLVLVLEDLQWGDLPTVKIIDSALRNLEQTPLLVIATARPEVHELFPRLWAERHPQEIRVGPLLPKASERLVRHVLGDAVPPEAIARIVGHAAGHPLHLEEIIRAVAEGGGASLPDTVLAMVEARLEALDPEARRLLRAASVFGRLFWASGVEALVGRTEASGAAGEWLELLVEREWIAARETSTLPGQTEYVFRQDVVREAAYAMLLEQDRALGHRLAGAWLEKAGERSGVVLARHFELGGDAARAVEHYLAAAEQALDGNDFAAAVAHGERVAALGAAGEALGRARAAQAEASAHRAAYEDARRLGAEALELLPRGSAPWCRAAGAVAQASGKLSALDGVQAAARALLSLAPDVPRGVAFAAACAPAVIQLLIGGDSALAASLIEALRRLEALPAGKDPAVAGQILRARGARHAFGGDPGLSLTLLRASVAAFEAAGDLRSVCSLRNTQGWYAAECGALEEGEQALRDAVPLAERMGLPNLVAQVKHNLGLPLLRLGRLDEARRVEEEALEVFIVQGDRRLESGAHGYLSWIGVLAGDPATAEAEGRRSVSSAPSAPVQVSAQAFLAAALLAAGRAAEALDAAREGMRLLEACGVTEEGVSLLYLVHAEALLATGDRASARAAIGAAREKLLSRSLKIGDPGLRATFLERIAENARTLALARAWVDEEPA